MPSASGGQEILVVSGGKGYIFNAPLQFHPDAFALTMSPLANRMDVLYGVGTVRPNLAVRVSP